MSTLPFRVEGIIDVDPSRFTSNTERIYITDSLTEYLLRRNFSFKKNFSSGRHRGVHFIIEFLLTEPLQLLTNIASPVNYFNNLKEKLIVNSVRESMTALLLGCFKESKSQQLYKICSLEHDPYLIHLDVSRTAFRVGRCSALSMHQGISRIVYPYPAKEMINSIKQFNWITEQSKLDRAYANAEYLHKEWYTDSVLRKNVSIIKECNEENMNVWKGYHMTQNKYEYIKNL